MLDFRIDTFLEVCKLLNYTRAAEALHITQPAVSQQIRFLEEYYDAKLFSYEGRKLKLTEAGRLLLNAATTMKHDEMILGELLKIGKRPKFSFGATLTIGDYVMPEKIARYLELHPEAEITMLVDNTETLLKNIDIGALDFAVVEGYFHKAEYDYRVYSREHYIAVCSGSYVFENTPESISDLFNSRIILREQGSGTREILERYLEERNCSVQDFQQITEIGSISAIKSLVCGCYGISFLYEAAVEQELKSGALRQIHLSDFEVYNSFAFVWRKNSIFGDRYLNMFDDLFV